MYLGETKNGDMTGYGVYVWANGNARFGNFVNGKAKGVVMFLAHNAEWETGCWYGDNYASISSSVSNRERASMNSQARAQAFSQAMGAVASGFSSVASSISQSQGSNDNSGAFGSSTNDNSGAGSSSKDNSTKSTDPQNCFNLQKAYSGQLDNIRRVLDVWDDDRAYDIKNKVYHRTNGNRDLLRGILKDIDDLKKSATRMGCSIQYNSSLESEAKTKVNFQPNW
jgi:hypothetical protein